MDRSTVFHPMLIVFDESIKYGNIIYKYGKLLVLQWYQYLIFMIILQV